MAPPDFNKTTIDTLAKRAAFKCSNPDCRVTTVGPNSEIKKSTIIGEAAHIFGARPDSKRYRPDMTDAARAEITNSIWLCRNCHKLIDSDAQRFTSDLLFAWREEHEKYILSELGSTTDRIQFQSQASKLSIFENYPPLIRRIVIDKPEGWEWRLTAELMRHLNRPLFRKIEDLRDGLYVKPQKHIDEEEVINWVRRQLSEASILLTPLVSLIDRLNKSWGPQGEQGSVEEIYHITSLIHDHLEQIIRFEEQVYFVSVPQKYEKLVELLKNVTGSQAAKLEEIPNSLDGFVALLSEDHGGTKEKPYIVRKKITFDVPKDWEKQMSRELKRLKRHQSHFPSNSSVTNGCLLAVVGFIIICLLIWII
jgi:hypothetical protein